MSALIQQDWQPKTLKELFIQWQAVSLESWMHTSRLLMPHVQKGVKLSDIHPYLEKSKSDTGRVVKPIKRFQRRETCLPSEDSRD